MTLILVTGDFYESLQEMQSKLKTEAQIYYFHNEVKTVFEQLYSEYDIKKVFSHQEIGTKITFVRDIAIQSFLRIMTFYGNNRSCTV